MYLPYMLRLPQLHFGAKCQQLQADIKARNPSLASEDFLTVRDPSTRPYMVLGITLLGREFFLRKNITGVALFHFVSLYLFWMQMNLSSFLQGHMLWTRS